MQFWFHKDFLVIWSCVDSELTNEYDAAAIIVNLNASSKLTATVVQEILKEKEKYLPENFLEVIAKDPNLILDNKKTPPPVDYDCSHGWLYIDAVVFYVVLALLIFLCCVLQVDWPDNKFYPFVA